MRELNSTWERETRIDLLARAVQRARGVPIERPPLRINVQAVDLPEPHLVKRVQIGGTLGLVWATVWCREHSAAPTGSPVPWNPAEVYPWTVEVHGWWPDANDEDGRRIGVVVTAPCWVDPRVPSPEADAAIRFVVARAVLHEAQEGLFIDGDRLDPHEHGEIGLEEMARIHGHGPERLVVS